MTESAPLEILNINAGRVLAVVAHPDDLEYGAAAAVARWTDEGSEVVYVLASRGEAGIDGMDPATAAPLREAEQRAGGLHVGVEVVEFLGYPDGVIEYGTALRRDIAAKIREHRPDTLLLFNHREGWGQPGSYNSPDHRNVGSAALDAAGDAGNRWIFTDLALEPHHVKRALVSGSPQARHAIEVGASAVDRAVESLREHRAYLDGLGDHAMADPEVVRMHLETAGVRAGVGAAVAFEVFSF